MNSESDYASIFGLGFVLGGVIMIWCLTAPRRPAPSAKNDPERHAAILPAVITGIIAGAWMAATLTSSVVGPLIIGAIIGMIAMVRAHFDAHVD